MSRDGHVMTVKEFLTLLRNGQATTGKKLAGIVAQWAGDDRERTCWHHRVMGVQQQGKNLLALSQDGCAMTGNELAGIVR